MGVKVDIANLSKNQDVFSIKTNIPTLIDSGASDHCFAERSMFISYTPLDVAATRLSAGKDSTFGIIGRGTVGFVSIVNGQQKKITLDDALHTLDL